MKIQNIAYKYADFMTNFYMVTTANCIDDVLNKGPEEYKTLYFQFNSCKNLKVTFLGNIFIANYSKYRFSRDTIRLDISF